MSLSLRSLLSMSCWLMAVWLATFDSAVAFSPSHASHNCLASRLANKHSFSSSRLELSPADVLSTAPTEAVVSTASSSQLFLAAETIDPTSFLSNALGSFIGSPAVLAIPIVAALGVASLVVYLIVAYASPAEPDDETL